VATFFGLLGVVVFILPRVASLSLATLSDRYTAAASEVERARFVAAGETLSVQVAPTPQTIGFLFMAIAVLILSIVMLQAHVFNQWTAYVGIAAGAFTIADHVSLFSGSSLAAPLMMLSGIFWIPWWILIGVSLLRLVNRYD
jgi:hypothetical protein